jgi:hypothetical protein
MKRKDSLPVFWVLVDKRGKIIEKDDLRPTEFGKAGCPNETFWKYKSHAEEVRKQIREKMGEAIWGTWQLRVVKYERVQ